MIKDGKNIILYHGTTHKFQVPDLRHTRGQKDFGAGFYLTTDKEQALKFAKSQAIRDKKNIYYVHQYKLDSFDGLIVREFERADDIWLKFICANRSTKLRAGGYDIIIGKIADDDTRATLESYMSGVFIEAAKQLGVTNEQFTIHLLKTDRLKNQICIRTEKALNRIKYIKTIIGG